MKASSGRPALRIRSLAGLLAAIPHLLGFTPENSLVVVGATAEGRVQIAFRYDLPDPPDAAVAAEITRHAISVLAHQQLTVAVVAGYGPGRLVTPLADAFRAAAPGTSPRLHDVLRIEDGRYWSYLCTNPACCPAEGVSFHPAAHPAAKALAGAGRPALPGRDALAATIAPLTGPAAKTMRQATEQAERAASRLITGKGPEALNRPGLAAVRAAISLYRDGEPVVPAIGFAWLALALTRLRIRDDAWARMDPQYRDAHRRLWTDVVRRAQAGYVAAPACLLAFTAWQGGDGALANIAIDRALADTPGYSMAVLLRGILDAGTPPSLATPPMTPEQVADSYATTRKPAPGSDQAAESSGQPGPPESGDPDATSTT
ncbi:MAG TPA: DUF4192 domain-containing protein [Streptosporangiaceae bacterium]|nr:DUF4192 domain-containing protein [Streptosporangiaceae bacterium]